jgi:hypothetical protein
MRRHDISRHGSAIPEATRPNEVLMVITRAEVPVGNGLAGTRRVDEASTSGINSNVIYVSTVDAEEDEIAGRKGIQCNRTRSALLRVGCAWYLDPCTLIDVDRQPAAIESL